MIGWLIILLIVSIVFFFIGKEYALRKIFKPGTGEFTWSGRQGKKARLVELGEYYHYRVVKKTSESAFSSIGSGYCNSGGHYCDYRIEYWPKPK